MLKVTVLDLYCTQNGEWINFDNSRKILIIGSARMFYEFSSLFSFICNSIFSGLFCYIFLDFSLKVRVQLMHESGRTHFLRKTLIMDKIWVQNQLFPNSGCLLFLKLHLVMGSKKWVKHLRFLNFSVNLFIRLLWKQTLWKALKSG